MAGFAKKFESAKQDWTTPDDLFNPINAEFKFTLDAAADAINARAEKFFCVTDDGLRQDWVQFEVTLSEQSADMLKELATRGIYGRTPAEVGGRFIEQALQQFVETPKLVPGRSAAVHKG
jgi:hypothetical protein